MLENPKVQFRLNNPDTQETLGIRHITKINNNNKTDHRKLKDEQHEPPAADAKPNYSNKAIFLRS
jgi:hypothetical protein